MSIAGAIAHKTSGFEIRDKRDIERKYKRDRGSVKTSAERVTEKDEIRKLRSALRGFFRVFIVKSDVIR